MIKPAKLRAALVTACPPLAANPDKLLVFADAGIIAATGGPSPSFEYRYQLNLILLDFSGEPDRIFVALIEWVKAYQPDLVTNRDLRNTGISFEVDILNDSTSDLAIKLQLTESVIVSVDASGTRTITHVDDSNEQWTTP